MPNHSFLPADSVLDRTDPAYVAAEAFLSQYSNTGTLDIYNRDLRLFFTWCQDNNLHPLRDITRHQLAIYRQHMEDGPRKLKPSTVYGRLANLHAYYVSCLIDDYIVKDPCLGLRMPKVWSDDSRKVWLTRFEIGALLRQAGLAKSPADLALVHLLGSLGLRVTCVCSIDIEHITEMRQGYRWLHTIGKGGKPALRPIPPPVMEVLEAAMGDRKSGPLLLRRDGSRMTRRSADKVIKRLSQPLGLPSFLSPHDLRRSFIANALDAGASLRDVQLAVDHEDPRSTARYDRSTQSPHGHPSMLMAGLHAAAS